MPVFTIIYNGQRKSITTSPRAPVQELVQLTIAGFKLEDSATIRIRYRNNILDPAQLLFVYNIPNNASLEVELLTQRSAGKALGSVTTKGQTKLSLILYDKTIETRTFR